MVQAMMRKNQKMIWTAIAVVVVITFVFWGVATGPSMGGGNGNVGSIYGKKVSFQDFRNAHRAVSIKFLMAGQDVERSEYGQRILEQQAWVRLIQEKKVKEWNIVVTDEELVQYLRSMFSPEGNFDPQFYRQFLDRQLPAWRVSQAEFEQMMREDLAIQRLQRIIASTAKVTPQEARSVYDIIHEKMDVAVVRFEASQHTNDVKLTDADLLDFFEKNKETFRVPERRKVRYVRFVPEAFTNKVTIANFEVEQFYDQNKSLFTDETGATQPLETVAEEIRKRLLRQALLKRTHDVATQLMLEIAKKQDPDKEEQGADVDFDALAKQFGATPQETDFFEPGEPIRGIEPGVGFYRAAFSLTPEDPFSEPVAGDDGVYVLQYAGKKESELPTFEAAKEKVQRRLTMVRATEMAQSKGRDAAAQVRNAVAAARSARTEVDPGEIAKVFEEQCKKLGLKVIDPPPFSQREPAEELDDAFSVLATAFAMREGEVSDYVETQRGGFFLLLKDRIPPADEEYAKERGQFMNQLLAQRRNTVYNEWLNREVRLANPPFLSQPPPVQQPMPEKAATSPS